MSDPTLLHAPLGKETEYAEHYDPSLLFAIARDAGRAHLNLRPHPAWHGADIWNAYELSWLNTKGKPQVALARFGFPADTTHIIESKSFKLYLNSFNQTTLPDSDALLAAMQQDLSKAAGGPVDVTLFNAADFADQALGELHGTLLDTLDIDVCAYHPDPTLLQANASQSRHETLRSNLLKSNCPVTGQPDWGSLQIEYTGAAIDHASLLKYIVSYRGHNGFHEQCVEQIFCDIMQVCAPQALTVYARYTRRGGLDINPWRSTEADFTPSAGRNARQ
ncbi:NADPH-dependent 7-cyano-7-deazaguanine reductase QueF [Advenella sp. S44]|uniref:NADPH-dependent 7-cyano-7-deazaguanine reductase QueF n=1 Tax=Advenella sp. S44 TaxID=1982755 RepID=UPI000C29BF9D|nr:NADPH-dependent 7-cyano-7-deazaguanine reductase QueF [Advenella sp. S44]PJX20478.1 NADPH-dependent 7-cyano-7-deazaguanine reductase QueF [Advenella sp. S44]